MRQNGVSFDKNKLVSIKEIAKKYATYVLNIQLVKLFQIMFCSNPPSSDMNIVRVVEEMYLFK